MLATGHGADVLANRRILLTPKVRAESLFVYADETRSERMHIDEEHLMRAGIHYAAVELDDPEKALAVRLAAFVDDGEAETLAVASLRGLGLLTDDLGAIRVATSEQIRVETTLDLLRTWAHGRSAKELRACLNRLQNAGNYKPPRNHPLYRWFLDAVSLH